MKTADFIYYYAKLYHRFVVKTVLMRENWEDKDFDAKYAKYMQEYIKIRKEFEGKKLSDDTIKLLWNGLKKNVSIPLTIVYSIA